MNFIDQMCNWNCKRNIHIEFDSPDLCWAGLSLLKVTHDHNIETIVHHLFASNCWKWDLRGKLSRNTYLERNVVHCRNEFLYFGTQVIHCCLQTKVPRWSYLQDVSLRSHRYPKSIENLLARRPFPRLIPRCDGLVPLGYSWGNCDGASDGVTALRHRREWRQGRFILDDHRVVGGRHVRAREVQAGRDWSSVAVFTMVLAVWLFFVIILKKKYT